MEIHILRLHNHDPNPNPLQINNGYQYGTFPQSRFFSSLRMTQVKIPRLGSKHIFLKPQSGKQFSHRFLQSLITTISVDTFNPTDSA